MLEVLNGLSHVELADVAKRASEMIDERREAGRVALVADIKAMVKDRGYTLADLRLAAEPEKTRKPAKIKYRNPNNHNQTWTGQGRAPAWFCELVMATGSRDSARVS